MWMKDRERPSFFELPALLRRNWSLPYPKVAGQCLAAKLEKFVELLDGKSGLSDDVPECAGPDLFVIRND